MNRSVSRFAYRLLLRLHPAGFEDEFGAEMLWIFDEEHQQGRGAHLLLDGAISLLRQRCRIEHDPGQLSIASGTIITGPGIRRGVDLTAYPKTVVDTEDTFATASYLLGLPISPEIDCRMG